jgi:Ca2+-transporting ATPase
LSVSGQPDAGTAGDARFPPGLSAEEAARRLQEAGPNELARAQPTSVLERLLRQFISPVIGLLLAASAVSALLGELLDAAAIGVILIVNAIVGFVQEHRAERAIAALGSITAPRARVVRDGRTQIVPAREVVPGDILVLEAGDIVAADARLLDAHALTTNEAALTGESTPVEKTLEPAPADAPVAERRNSVFMGTSVATGTALATVDATGMSAELGKIANLLTTAERGETPLQQRLERVSRLLALLCGGIVIVVAAMGIARGWSAFEVFMSAVSLAVAAVPEGLPAVVTVALAIGVQRMAARHVLVRRLASIETLGCVTVICTDKTGTLTTGVMVVREVWGADRDRVLFAAAACCDAELGVDGRGGVGDPTELAILAAANERGILRNEIERTRPRVAERPFDPASKSMSVTRGDGLTYIKGAIDVLAGRVTGGADAALAAHGEMAARGLRVLAVGTAHEPDGALDFVGLIGVADPPRAEAVAAVAAARRAGVMTVMITGDHPVTAQAIAQELGLIQQGDDPAGRVHARATPTDKLRIVRDWKAHNHIVAMTGDGVNDAPALREAHVGIAMGITGTEVTRGASDLVLADDNFASIVAGMHEGRAVFENIRKTLVYLLIGNVAELAVMLVSALAGLPLPLLPLHLLWINIVTDGLPALALVMDPADEDLMDRPPRPTEEAMIGRAQWSSIAGPAAVEAGLAVAVFVWALRTQDLEHARALAFSTLVFSELFRSFAARSTSRTIWQVGPLSNLRLMAVVAASLAVQFGLYYLPVTRGLFALDSLTPAAIAVAAVVGLGPATLIECRKMALRFRHG